MKVDIHNSKSLGQLLVPILFYRPKIKVSCRGQSDCTKGNYQYLKHSQILRSSEVIKTTSTTFWINQQMYAAAAAAIPFHYRPTHTTQ